MESLRYIHDIYGKNRSKTAYENDMRYSLFIGRFAPLHDGHAAIIEKVLAEGKNVLVAIRDTPISPIDPYTYRERKEMFKKRFGKFGNRIKVIKILDIEE